MCARMPISSTSAARAITETVQHVVKVRGFQPLLRLLSANLLKQLLLPALSKDGKQ